MAQEKYYKVTAICGHVSRNKYILIDFPVKAENGKEAALKVRFFPRVKHHLKNAILDCVEITYDDYVELIKINSNDRYLSCKNIQEQRTIIGLEDRIFNFEKEEKKDRDTRNALFKIKKYNEYKKSMIREYSYI